MNFTPALLTKLVRELSHFSRPRKNRGTEEQNRKHGDHNSESGNSEGKGNYFE